VSREHPGTFGRRVLVLGGTSEIGLAIVAELQRLAPREVLLVGRDAAGLARAGEQLERAGIAGPLSLTLDARDLSRHGEVLDEAWERLGGVDLVILAVGILGERGGLPSDIAGALQVLEVNVLDAGSLLIHSAERLRRQGGGTVVVLSSVAAERARAANVVYGASKAGLDALAQGLSDALHPHGVGVLVVRPGFVATRMTRGLEPAPLATTPAVVARAVAQGLTRGAPTVWAPPALRWLMLVLRALPRPLHRRLGR
jgi:decaprenylphospho-beta-D-erythro-pentofuranosid-2-ulose 2-reductase